MFREVTDHPERMQKTMDDMMATWQKAQADVEAEDQVNSMLNSLGVKTPIFKRS